MKYSTMQNTLFLVITMATFTIAGCDSPGDESNTGTVQVTVKDFYSDEPIADAHVTLIPGDYAGTTGKDGTATFTGITSYRNYKAEVTHEDCSTEDHFGFGRTGFVRVKTGQTTNVVVPLKKSSVIHGTLTSGDTPVPDAFVVLSRMQFEVGVAPDFAQVALVVTDANGDYRFDRLPEGLYNLRALADLHYMTDDDLTLEAGQVLEQNIALTAGTTTLSFTIGTEGTHYYGEGQTVTVAPSDSGQSYAERYLAIIDLPEGGEAVPGEFSHQFSGTVPGDHTAVMMLTDLSGVCKLSPPVVITLINHPTEAYPTVIPGPSELPLLDSSTVLAETGGTFTVQPGQRVYFRGWGRDINISSPETYNAQAPMFDKYGNKNGDWGQSGFSFTWGLRDGTEADRSDLLSATTAQNVHFEVPANAASGDTFTAILTVTGDYDLAGPPAEISVAVAGRVGNESCVYCHSDAHATYQDTAHHQFSVNCEDCHGPGSLHGVSAANITKTHWPGNCGQCHLQFAQWQRSRHSDPLAFGHAEIPVLLLGSCYKCHYTDGFIGAVESPEGFHEFTYKNLDAEAVPKDTPNVSCDVCHGPHLQSADNPTGIRTGSGENLCNTCHAKKWQNATYTGTGDAIGNAAHLADYSQYQGAGNPHLMPNGCVTCHMAGDITKTDNRDVRKVGAHTLRMREAGADGVLGTDDDLLNIGICQSCHPGLETFDRNGVMTRIEDKLNTLEDLLKKANHEYLPPFQPGKCATCHKGGTLPFMNESEDEIMEKAYLNYKLILHDRSLGIHNPGYIERLLDDSIAGIQDADLDPNTGQATGPATDCGMPGTGYGACCDDTTPCLGEIDFCLINGAPGSPGTCTSKDCTAVSCPAAYTCLDCTNFSFGDYGLFCGPDDTVDLLLGFDCILQE